MSAHVITLGCRMNLAESEEIAGLLDGEGDLVVVNSCAVTSEAVRQTRQAIRRARKERPHARLLVTGCAAEVERTQLARMPEVDGIIANSAKLDARAWNVSPHAPSLHKSHTRAFVVVQTGCDHACTFCIIPRGRGVSRSRPIADVLRDVERHLQGGAQEIVLTGVDLASWGADFSDKLRLGRLVWAILDAFPALRRLRLSSLDGIEIDDELLDLIVSEPRIMPYVHLSLQSGDDMTLKRMRRRHLSSDAARLIYALRARRPEIAIGADLIAGFPTESEDAHQRTLASIADLGIVHGHVFAYSRRPGTPAARMPQVAGDIIRRRAAELREAVAKEHESWLYRQLGTPHAVLAERGGTGHAPNFARVRVPEGTPHGAIVTITPSRIEEGILV